MTTWQDVAIAGIGALQILATIWSKRTYNKVMRCGSDQCKKAVQHEIQFHQVTGVPMPAVNFTDQEKT